MVPVLKKTFVSSVLLLKYCIKKYSKENTLPDTIVLLFTIIEIIVPEEVHRS
jgi:hypothetical protein